MWRGAGQDQCDCTPGNRSLSVSFLLFLVFLTSFTYFSLLESYLAGSLQFTYGSMLHNNNNKNINNSHNKKNLEVLSVRVWVFAQIGIKFVA